MNIRLLFFQIIAPVYDGLHFSSARRTVAAMLQTEVLGLDKSILDLGGGTGRLAKHIKEHVREVTVVDASTSMLKVCHKRGLNCVLGQAENIPCDSDSFDSVVITDAWHHFPEPEKTLAEIKRVLKPGGKVFIEEVNTKSIFGWLLMIAEKILFMGSRFYHSDQLSTLVARDFTGVEPLTSNKNFYIVTGIK
ncbi:hypothetical protein COT97_03750 [Candidatus Falkowbacteria bacterium CG10_big_fil_rev_8_21_14_0_10_39_11]|uniref:Methyltransferase type 11 domain-containing protein n=1 Tax=Candidatus Falkowbacteria bacterium CG10_big_fil_rev_8_21_14_0_10_39_11 TaxID=1974565 RepID=A0A2H0V4G6_9BACT|nr:MAG: hypothetical protein COT97_03750 [Candidatus Falkowbacteria bacterium CG10_big_fil_rev_8_21_14_0_10_39_11]